MSSAIVPTYARADVTFERGDGCWLTTTTGERYLDFGAGIAVVLARPFASASRRDADRPGRASSGTPRTCSRCPRASASRAGSPTRPSPISSSSPIPAPRRTRPRSRWRASVSAVGGHPERFHILTFEGAFHGRTLATLAAGGQAKYLEGFGPKVAGLRPDPDHRSRRGRGRDRAGDGRDHDRADPGRGRRARRSAARSCGACARSATSTACC